MRKVKREKQEAKVWAVGPCQHLEDWKSQPWVMSRSDWKVCKEMEDEGGKCHVE